MTTLKIQKFDNSLGIILPKDVIERLYLQENDLLKLVEKEDGFYLLPYNLTFTKGTAAFSKTNKKYRKVLKELSR